MTSYFIHFFSKPLKATILQACEEAKQSSNSLFSLGNESGTSILHILNHSLLTSVEGHLLERKTLYFQSSPLFLSGDNTFMPIHSFRPHNLLVSTMIFLSVQLFHSSIKLILCTISRNLFKIPPSSIEKLSPFNHLIMLKVLFLSFNILP